MCFVDVFKLQLNQMYVIQPIKVGNFKFSLTDPLCTPV